MPSTITMGAALLDTTCTSVIEYQAIDAYGETLPSSWNPTNTEFTFPVADVAPGMNYVVPLLIDQVKVYQF